MHAGSVLDIVIGGVVLAAVLWLCGRIGASVNEEQVKRCGPVVIAFYVFMAAYFLMSLCLVCFGTYCILGNLPIPWAARAVYGAIVIAAIGAPALLQSSSVLRRDPQPVNWAFELRQMKRGIRQRLGLDDRR